MLDLDGTLVESSLVEIDGKLQPAPGIFSEPRLQPNVLEKIADLADEGDEFAIVTNQGGVAWGYATPAEAYARIGRAVALLHGFFGRPFSVHVCFAHPRATIKQYREGHERRKPAPAMLREALKAHGREGLYPDQPPEDAIMVGDLEDDEKAARAAGVDFVPAGTFFTW
jgi:HAD superfamily hydrolase (TIGR01662 family)